MRFVLFTLPYSVLTIRNLFPQKRKGGGTPTNADPTTALARGARSAERARLSAFHHGSHLRELFHPKGSASGQASWDVVCAGVTRLRLSQSRDAPPTPVIMPGDMMPKPPGSRLQIRPRAPHLLHLSVCLRKASFRRAGGMLVSKCERRSQALSRSGNASPV
jgi:hypothetical protein